MAFPLDQDLEGYIALRTSQIWKTYLYLWAKSYQNTNYCDIKKIHVYKEMICPTKRSWHSIMKCICVFRETRHYKNRFMHQTRTRWQILDGKLPKGHLITSWSRFYSHPLPRKTNVDMSSGYISTWPLILALTLSPLFGISLLTCHLRARIKAPYLTHDLAQPARVMPQGHRAKDVSGMLI